MKHNQSSFYNQWKVSSKGMKLLLKVVASKENASSDVNTIRGAQSDRQVRLGSNLSLLLILQICHFIHVIGEIICKISNKGYHCLDCQIIGFLIRKQISVLSYRVPLLYADERQTKSLNLYHCFYLKKVSNNLFAIFFLL